MIDLTTRTSRLFWPVVIAIAAAFFATEHDPAVSLADAYTSTEDEMEAAAAGGNALRRAAFLGLGGLGLVLLVLPGDRAWRLDTPRAVPLVLFAAWCGLSVLWSDDASLTLRRLSVFGCLAVAVLGLTRHVTPRDLLRAALTISTIYLVAGIAAELRNGTFHPAHAEFRFAGTLHPNTQGLNLAILCLSAFCLAREATRRRVLPWGLFAVGMLFLVLTKSRTSLAGVVAALGLIWAVRTPLARKFAIAAVGLWLAAAAGLAMLLAGVDAGDDLSRLALLGRESEAASLTGRLPLWTELSGWAAERPLTGYGYDSFWTADRIDAVSAEMMWGLREAHSAYLDWVLSVGLIGAGLLLAGVLAGLWRAGVLFRASGRAELGFVCGWTTFCLINALTESALMMPLYATFVAACGLAGVLLRPAAALVSLSPSAAQGDHLSQPANAAPALRPHSALGGAT
jgi:exopolysaccharide production protein ExoQ